MTHPPDKPSLRRVLRVKDLVFFYVTAVVGQRWVASAAAAGPSSLVIWALSALTLFVPLAFTVIELSSRYPDEGGIYVWTKRAFGDFGGFMTGWIYWGSNLTYVPGLLYFGASTALYIFGSRFLHLQGHGGYFVVMAIGGLALAAALNIVGLEVGKWFSTVGAVGTWIPMALLIGMGLVSCVKFGAATPISGESVLPDLGVKNMVFWATIAFAFTGIEAASFMGEEIVNPRHSIARAIAIAGTMIAAIYMLGTLAILVALPQEQISGLAGIMDALVATGRRLGIAGLVPLSALLITLAAFGGAGVWLAATARLPFVAGIDRYLPGAFGRLHPRFGTPHVALLLQTGIAAVCVALGQAGQKPREAYEILVNIAIVATFLPYVMMFAAMIRLQREPAGPEVIRVPGGAPVAILLAGMGLATTIMAIVLACVPPAGEAAPLRYVIKVVGLTVLLVASGVLAYVLGNSRRRRS